MHRATSSSVPARVPRLLWEGSLLTSGGRLIGTAATAVELVLAARLLPAAVFGRLTFLLSLLVVLESLTDLGTGAAVLARGGRGLARFARALDAARRLRRWTAAAALALLLVAGLALGESLAWLALAGALFLSRIPETSGLAFQRDLRFAPVVGARAVGAVTRALLVTGLLLSGVRAAAPLLAGHALGLALGNALVHVSARAHRVLPPRTRGRAPALLRLALPLGAAGLVHQATLYADNLFLHALRGEAELGRYNAAARVASFLLIFATNATVVALPWLARLHAEGALASATGALSRALLAPACLVLGLLLPFAPEVLAGLFGAPFAAAGTSLRVLLVSALVVHAAAGWLTALVATGAGRRVLGLTAGALAVAVVGNALLVPTWGSTGAAAATLVTELFLAAGAWRALDGAGAAPRIEVASWLRGAALFLAAAAVSFAARALL